MSATARSKSIQEEYHIPVAAMTLRWASLARMHDALFIRHAFVVNCADTTNSRATCFTARFAVLANMPLRGALEFSNAWL